MYENGKEGREVMSHDVLHAVSDYRAIDRMRPSTRVTATTPVEPPKPANRGERSANELRPAKLDDMVGQDRAVSIVRRVLDASSDTGRPLDHMLLVGPAGVGKSTLANCVANELDVDCYQLAAPVSLDMLLILRETMLDEDILFIDEIHQQAMAERRGRNATTEPEVLYSVLEDRTIVTPTGVQPFPKITVIGATTDEGLLPDPFIGRFPLRPVFEHYTQRDLARIAKANADALGLGITLEAALAFARACRGIPRQVNNFVRNAASLTADKIDLGLATEVVRDLNRTTPDGLTLDMQRMLVFLYRKGRHKTKGTGEISYMASLATVAVALGKSRDQRALQLRIEPYLIEKGYLQVGHGGRSLTPAGERRAKELAKAGVA